MMMIDSRPQDSSDLFDAKLFSSSKASFSVGYPRRNIHTSRRSRGHCDDGPSLEEYFSKEDDMASPLDSVGWLSQRLRKASKVCRHLRRLFQLATCVSTPTSAHDNVSFDPPFVCQAIIACGSALKKGYMQPVRFDEADPRLCSLHTAGPRQSLVHCTQSSLDLLLLARRQARRYCTPQESARSLPRWKKRLARLQSVAFDQYFSLVKRGLVLQSSLNSASASPVSNSAEANKKCIFASGTQQKRVLLYSYDNRAFKTGACERLTTYR